MQREEYKPIITRSFPFDISSSCHKRCTHRNADAGKSQVLIQIIFLKLELFDLFKLKFSLFQIKRPPYLSQS